MNTKLLRQKVLDLAIHGKLVPQNPEHESAAELLKRIKEGGSLPLATAGKPSSATPSPRGKAPKTSSTPISEDEIPFEIPENWCWCRLNEIADIARGGSPRPIDDFLTDNENGINWIKIGDTNEGDKYITHVKEKIKPEGVRHSRFVHSGDFLLTNSMSFGRPYILKVDGCIHDGWLVFANIKKNLIQDYLYYGLSSLYIYQSFSLVAAGSTVKNLKSDTVKQVLFPLPPLEEQKLIVEEIERIFALIDTVEQNKTDLETVIKQTKSKILGLAIHGKLVPQDKADEPASKMLEKLRTEKASRHPELVSGSKLKRDKNDSYIYRADDGKWIERKPDGTEEEITDELYFKLPSGWVYARYKDFATFTGGAQPPKDTFEYEPTEDNIRLIQIRDYKTDEFATYIPKSKARRFCSADDVMIGRYGPPIFQILRGIEGSYNVAIMKAEVDPRLMTKDYLYYLLKERRLLLLLESISDRTCGQDGVNVNVLNDYIVGIPPIEEQKRIVSNLEKLFNLLDSITKSIGA